MQENPVVLSLARAGIRERDISNNEGQIAESYFNYNPVDIDDLLLNPMDLYSGANCSISKVKGVISPAYVNLRGTNDVNPVFYDYYFDILDTKYYFYCGTVICMAAVMLLLTLIILRLNKGTIVMTPKLRKSDWAMIGFLFSIVLSCIWSDYRFEAFWGTEGRLMGTFLYLICGISFFTLGHCLKFKRWYLEAFLVTGMVVCSIGIMQYFLIDPFGFKKDSTLLLSPQLVISIHTLLM